MRKNTSSKEFKYKHADRRSCRVYSLQLYLDEPNHFKLIQLFIDWSNKKNSDPEYEDSFIEEVVFIKHDKDTYDKDCYKDKLTDKKVNLPKSVKDVDAYLKEHSNIIKEHSKGDVKKPHYHAVLYLHNVYTRLKLSIKYNISTNFIECCDYQYANEMLLYLSHVKQPLKYQYPVDSIQGYKGGTKYLRCLDYNSEVVDVPPDSEIFDLCRDFIKDNLITDESEVINFLLHQKFPMTISKARTFALSFNTLYRTNRDNQSVSLMSKHLEDDLHKTKDIISSRMYSIEYNERKKIEESKMKIAKFLYYANTHQDEFMDNSNWYDLEYIWSLPDTDDFKKFYNKFLDTMDKFEQN